MQAFRYTYIYIVQRALDITIKYLRQTTDGAAGNAKGATAK
jgi:hypothetical protein